MHDSEKKSMTAKKMHDSEKKSMTAKKSHDSEKKSKILTAKYVTTLIQYKTFLELKISIMVPAKIDFV